MDLSRQRIKKDKRVNRKGWYWWLRITLTDILSQADWTNVKAWIFGHTHYTTELKKGGVKVVSNQRGYVLPGAATGLDLKKMENRTGFNVRKVIRI